MVGMEHWNGIEPVFDVTGYPCELSGPFPQDGCPMIARAWFALELDGPNGTVRQPEHVLSLVGSARSPNPIVLHDSESGAPVGVVRLTKSDLTVRARLGFDAEGAFAAVALEAADAADVRA